MGLIQTVEQLKFSYMAIVEGAKQLGHLPKDALSDLVGPKPPDPIQTNPSDSDSSSDWEFDDENDNDDSDNDELAPPIPPRRSESLLKSNLFNSNGVESFRNMPEFLLGNFQFSIG